MLVISRKEGEKIVIRIPGREQPIIIKLADHRWDCCRFGIEAERDIIIDRLEVDARKQAQSSSPPGIVAA